MDKQADVLQIKIDKARNNLTEEARTAIDSVDWKNIIVKMRETRGYTFEQLESLEMETELLLCGLLSSEEYPKQLLKGMGLPMAQVNLLVNEMNVLVFGRIKEELIKIIDSKGRKIETKKADAPAVNISSGIKIIRPGEEVIDKAKIQSILNQKLESSVQTTTVKTDYSLKNLPSSRGQNAAEVTKVVDPYREPPE